MACLDDQTVLDMVEGRLSSEARRAAVAHADGCSTCRELIAGAAVALMPDSDGGLGPTEPSSAVLAALAPGSQVGRYRILDLVGSGGMGVVYAAYDPELDRRVALKLVRGSHGPGAESQRARLQREARAIARVAHPNVVGVHDVGAIGDQVFIAMEFVEGSTLTSWLKLAPRSFAERLEVLLQAGRGLLAAHLSGLVHRDFKPDNVLVGRDGRVRVTDFGLARPPGELGLAAVREAKSDLAASPDHPLTRTGAFVGTPAYMAPEQMRGESIDPRADVFSFCVAAWECLYGARPFAGATAEELSRAIREGAVADPPASSAASPEVPARVRRALLTGLRADPSLRPASLEPLLAQLAPPPKNSHRPWVLFGAAVVALSIALSFIAARMSQKERARASCEAGDTRLAGIWDAGRKQALEQALASGDGDTVHALTGALDRYAASWTAHRREACEATQVRGEQSTATLELRVECLEQRRRELDAFIAGVTQSPEHLVRAAVRAYQLPPISECDNVAALRSVLHPTIPAPAMDALRQRLARLQVGRFVTDHKGEEAEAKSLAEAATRAGAYDVAAGALAVIGAARQAEDDLDQTRAEQRDAAIVAGMAHDDLTLVHVLTSLIVVEGVIGSNLEEAWRLIAYTKPVVARLGGHPRAEWQLLDAIAQLEWRSSRLADAEDHARQAVAWYERSSDPNPIDYASLLLDLADIVGDAGRFDESTKLYNHVLELYRTAIGPFHPQVLQVQNNMAVDTYEAGRSDEAARQMEAVVQLFQHHTQDRIATANALNSLAWMVSERDPARAEKLYHQSLDLYDQVVPAKAIDRSYPLTGLGIVQLALGRPREALVNLERALELQAQPDLLETTDRAETELALARALASGPRALALATHARDVLVAHPLGPRRAKLVAQARELVSSLGKK